MVEMFIQGGGDVEQRIVIGEGDTLFQAKQDGKWLSSTEFVPNNP